MCNVFIADGDVSCTSIESLCLKDHLARMVPNGFVFVEMCSHIDVCDSWLIRVESLIAAALTDRVGEISGQLSRINPCGEYTFLLASILSAVLKHWAVSNEQKSHGKHS